VGLRLAHAIQRREMQSHVNWQHQETQAPLHYTIKSSTKQKADAVLGALKRLFSCVSIYCVCPSASGIRQRVVSVPETRHQSHRKSPRMNHQLVPESKF